MANKDLLPTMQFKAIVSLLISSIQTNKKTLYTGTYIATYL